MPRDARHIHTYEDAMYVKALLLSHGIIVHIVGSIFTKRKSKHDIDLVICTRQNTEELKQQLIAFFNPKKVTDTDWGGYFFDKTKFGNLDFFFEEPVKEAHKPEKEIITIKVENRSNRYGNAVVFDAVNTLYTGCFTSGNYDKDNIVISSLDNATTYQDIVAKSMCTPFMVKLTLFKYLDNNKRLRNYKKRIWLEVENRNAFMSNIKTITPIIIMFGVNNTHYMIDGEAKLNIRDIPPRMAIEFKFEIDRK